MIKIDFILCTRNRPNAIRMLLGSICNLEVTELAKITIIDASDLPVSFSGIILPGHVELNVIDTQPGLPSQRNIGLASTENQIIVFLDDDVLLPKNFITATLKAFEEDNQLAGLGYLLRGVEYTSNGRFLNKVKNINASKFGQVTKSGLNLWYPEKTLRVENQPMWIPGCAMAFRRSEITNLLFNENLELGILGGYALGEDVDFTLRLFQGSGRIKLCTEIVVDHYEAPGERDNNLRLSKAQGSWLKYLSASFPALVPSRRVLLRLTTELSCLIPITRD
ncbi:MAG: glycosyltransferase [Proteobacteria bacterium]|nr:glycosyltransferase [Pseudomonadota bacterium]